MGSTGKSTAAAGVTVRPEGATTTITLEQSRAIQEVGDRLRSKGRAVGIKDAQEYMQQPGAEFNINYRDWRGNTSGYMSNKSDNGNGISVSGSQINKLVDWLNSNGYTRERNGGEYEYVYRKR